MARSSAVAPAVPVRSASTFGAFRSLLAAHPAFRGQGAEVERAEIVMSKRSTHHHATKPKASLYEEITAHIVADLEAGIFPWARPWGTGGGNQACALPRNAATGKAYSGINVLILWGRLFECSFASGRWLTFRQASSLGGTVRKGEHGVTICYADRFVPKREEGDASRTSQDLQDADGAAVPFLRRYTVFNVDQCDNLPDHCLVEAPPVPEHEIVPQAEALTIATRADIRIGGAKAFYSPSEDTVHVPPQPAFFEQINYYRTLFHELGHWTGHLSRLNRELSGAFGSKLYANEELIAELTAAFVCAALSIEPTVRHADYLGSWLKVLREDSRAIFRAASKASKAADFLLAFADGHATPATAAQPEIGR
ncbi:antirestriction protein ArdC [Bradyrhizobium sp. CIR18]|nr:antirestriction protein ArdC [Bradyrhizobium sp. CIR3A]MBB4360655.1 antirestriction protein ArdC [Bradyrhizobium sp. CIR18]